MDSNENDGIFFMDDEDPLTTVIEELKDLSKDALLQKNIKQLLEQCIAVIENDALDISIRVNKVCDILDDVCDDSNIESFSRTRIYNISQLLEKVC